MKATLYGGPRDISVGERLDSRIEQPTDAIVRVLMGCVCGSDLWYFRGESPHALGPIGHEFIGIVDEIGDNVSTLSTGDLVIAPFLWCCGECRPCQSGWPSNCVNGGSFGNHGHDGGQGEAVRSPYADATLVKVPSDDYDAVMMRSLLALSDVMCTGHHAAVSAGVQPGQTVAVVGDGAVGLCAVLAAHRLGAHRIIALSRNPDRQQVAKDFGATDIVPARGDGLSNASATSPTATAWMRSWSASAQASRWTPRSASPQSARSSAPSGCRMRLSCRSTR